ncbi:MAG: hypothetical protein ACP5H3_03735 [Candidatus Aenigmatarchaeota archaeon]
MKYTDLIEEAEMLIQYLSSPSVDENRIFYKFPTLIRLLYDYKDHETIQKLYNAYKKFYEERVIPQFKDQLKRKDFCYKCSTSDASILIESTILYSFIEEKLPLEEKEIASLILIFFLRGTERGDIVSFLELTKGFDLSNLDLTKLLASFNKKGLTNLIKKFTLCVTDLISSILFFVRNIEILERMKNYFNLLVLSEKLKSEDAKYIFEKLDFIFFITTNLKNGIKQRLENVLEILERKFLETPWIDKNLTKTLLESIKIDEITKYKVKISHNFSEIEKKIESNFMTGKINAESFFKNVRKLCSFDVVNKKIEQIMNTGSMTVFDSIKYCFLEKNEFIEKELEDTTKRYSELFSSEDKVKAKIKEVIKKVPPKIEERIKEIVHIYITNPPNLNEKFLHIIYNECVPLAKALNEKWITKFNCVEEKDFPLVDFPWVVFSYVVELSTKGPEKAEMNLKSLISKWEDPRLELFKNLFVFYQIRKTLTKNNPEIVKYFDGTLYQYFDPYPEIAFLITGRINKEFNVSLEKVLYFVCSCVFLLTIASEIPPFSCRSELLLQKESLYIGEIRNIFGLSCLCIERYFNLDNIFLKEIQSDKYFCALSFYEISRLGEALVKNLGKQRSIT